MPDRYRHTCTILVRHVFYTDAPLTETELRSIENNLDDDPLNSEEILDGLADLDRYDDKAGIDTHYATTEVVSQPLGDGTLADVLSQCDACLGPLSGTGDDYCGLCPSCTDKRYADE